MKKLFFIIIVLAIITGAGVVYKEFFKPQPSEKVYVAVEGESKVVAIDPATNKIFSTIDLALKHDDGLLPYAPHNIQVSPDMKSVWVTANAGKHQNHSSSLFPYARANGGGDGHDEVVVINPETDKIIKRIPIGDNLHLAHVALTPDSAYAYVSAQYEGAVYKINARTFKVEKKFLAPAPADQKEPHGLRISVDGTMAYIAMLKGGGLGALDLKTGNFSIIPLGGAAVQTGIVPDGSFIAVSLYDTKELALYNPNDGAVNKILLPQSAKGPVQMYPSPDSKYIYLADQGYYFGQPTSDLVYKIDVRLMKVIKEIKAGLGPHGAIVSQDGSRVYITNLISGDVSVIDASADAEIKRIKVGKEPNGISIWIKAD